MSEGEGVAYMSVSCLGGCGKGVEFWVMMGVKEERHPYHVMEGGGGGKV